MSSGTSAHCTLSRRRVADIGRQARRACTPTKITWHRTGMRHYPRHAGAAHALQILEPPKARNGAVHGMSVHM
eukprot:1514275-Amphidinium_carterae.1